MKIIRLLCLLALAEPTHAKFARPVAVPVERLESKAEAYLKTKPEDANGWYLLGRIHYLAFVMNSDSLNVGGGMPEDGSLPYLHHFQGGGKAGEKPKPITPAAVARHVAEALRCFDKALSLKADDGLVLLGKASLLEQYGEPDRQKALEKVASKPKPAAKEEIIALYLKAYDASKSEDAAVKYMPLLGLQELVSHEAGQAYAKLAPDGPRAAEISKHLAKLKELDMGPVTPMIAARAESIQQLFTGEQADFDVTGLGWTRSYPWPGGRAAFLVWDSECRGAIRDGRQLFGFYTWGIFWKDGYAALAMLDDNNDGVLADGELNGVSLWTDANANGISEPGEVVTAEDSAVKAIRVQAYFNEGVHPTCPNGIEFFDHEPWTTWDWMAEPVSSLPVPR